jgi:hypothetical protein
MTANGNGHAREGQLCAKQPFIDELENNKKRQNALEEYLTGCYY